MLRQTTGPSGVLVLYQLSQKYIAMIRFENNQPQTTKVSIATCVPYSQGHTLGITGNRIKFLFKSLTAVVEVLYIIFQWIAMVEYKRKQPGILKTSIVIFATDC